MLSAAWQLPSKPTLGTMQLSTASRLLPLIAVTSAHVAAQSVATACNNINEQSNSDGGYTNSQDEDCVQVTLGVPPAAIKSPDTCAVGYRFAETDTFRCAGELENWHCNPKAFKVNVTVASDGGCPEPPDFSDLDLSDVEDWLRIPGLVASSFVCVPPKKKTTQNDSADISACPGSGGSISRADGDTMVARGTQHAVWMSSVPSQDGATAMWNPFSTPYEAAQSGDPSQLGGILGHLAVSQLGASGANFTGSVEVQHWSAGAQEFHAARRVDVRGRMYVDSTFDIVRSIPAEDAGVPVVSTQRTAFDGRYLIDYQAGAEAGNIHEWGATMPAWVSEIYLDEARWIHGWLTDPYSIPLFDGVVYTESAGDGPDTTVVQRTHPLTSGDSFVGDAYQVVTRNGIPLPTHRSEFDVAGNAWIELGYSEFFEFRPGDWRPRSTTWTRHMDATGNGARVVVILTIATATPLESVAPISFAEAFGSILGWYQWLSY